MLLVLHDSGQSQTPADIAYAMGFAPFRAKGRAARMFSPAQKIIGPLTGLRRRDLVSTAARRDGLTGTAYVLTPWGRDVASALAVERLGAEGAAVTQATR